MSAGDNLGHVSDLLPRAVALARTKQPHPNPKVGALVVTPDGRVVGEGAHRGPGFPHAEIDALAEAGQDASGSTLVVTLEPCNHQGRTGPCVEAILDAGVAVVVVGAPDPNPDVTGGGIETLRAAGVQVEVHDPPILDSDPAYFHYHRSGLPAVTLKAALTVDGAVAALDGTSQWITNEAARRDAHRERARADAIIVGAGTVLADDPALTVRLDGYDGRQPVPVVVKGGRDLPPSAKVVERGALVYEPESGGRVALRPMLEDLARRGHLEVLVEGGPLLARAFWEQGLVDRGVFYLGAKIAGGAGRPVLDGPFATLGDARDVDIVAVDQLDGDVRLEFHVHRDR